MQKVILILAAILSTTAYAYTDDQLAMAIYHAEGGAATKYPFGIRSVYCGSFIDCKRCCKETIRNNRKRFILYGHKRYQSYIEYLASRYCPSTGRENAQGEHNAWIKNVNYFLRKG